MANTNTTKFGLALLASSVLSTPAVAQFAGPPPVHNNVDPNGVDLVSGNFTYAMREGVIGSGDGAVTLQRIWSQGGWKDNWSGGTYLGSDGSYYVDFGGYSDSFSLSGGVFTSLQASGATLVQGTGTYIYTAADGTTINFQYLSDPSDYPLKGYSCPNGTQVGSCAIPMEIKLPNGLKFVPTWDVVESAHNNAGFYRFRGITSSAGDSFTINYLSNSTGNLNVLTQPQTSWYAKTGVTFANAASACSGNCPSLTYSTSGGVTTVTDALNRSWRLDASTGSLTGLRRPEKRAIRQRSRMAELVERSAL
jgi:hypothetical protein